MSSPACIAGSGLAHEGELIQLNGFPEQVRQDAG